MIDDTDRKLIALLRANAREPAASLAKKLRVSRGTVQNRIARMLAGGAIRGFTVRVAADADANQMRAVMCIAIEGEKSGKVVQALKGFPEIENIYTTNGRWDLVAELCTGTLAHFSQALDQIRLIEGIAATETSLLLANAK
ncbi:MAG TPA: Lrp/AsnC family transcriptional regulator [Rhizomicrobium sp.]|nr:Lrp/AsnC family transcriptional regulator [Rhizomicrobium sp.]